jgi:dolichyl-phosphate-mannose--protein O-mannosyl transferase
LVFKHRQPSYGDAAARLNITQLWLYSYWKIPSILYLKILNPSLDWLPFHFYILGLASYLTNDLVYTPRLLTLLISALSIIPLYKIAFLKFNERTAIIAAVMLAFYGMHIFTSSLTLSEPFYCFALLWSYWFLEKHFTSSKPQASYLIGLSILYCSVFFAEI